MNPFQGVEDIMEAPEQPINILMLRVIGVSDTAVGASLVCCSSSCAALNSLLYSFYCLMSQNPAAAAVLTF